MWKQKTLKKKVRTGLRQNYWTVVSVCFLIALLTSAYPASTTFIGAHAVNPGSTLLIAGPFSPDSANSEVVIETLQNFLDNTAVSDFFASDHAFPVDFLIDLVSPGISAVISLLRAVNNYIAESWDASTFFLILGVLTALCYQLFIGNVLIVGEKRFFLEQHSYRKTPISKIFCLYKLRCLAGPVWIMFCRSFFQVLWNLTLIGGIIKYYEYRMIPFILAENPKINRKNAFFLSKQLMNRNKWKLFRLHLSFLGWKILAVLTFGILDLAFVNPYLTGCEAELYLTLRRNYVLSRSPRYECLNDSYLEHVPSEDELLISKALYDDSRGPYTKISYFAPEQYPVFLFSVQPPFRAVRSPVKADRKYSFLSLVFLFHAFSLLGYAGETAIHLIANGALPDAPTPFAPWLPIYGLYGILILLAVKHFYDKPALVFLLNFISYTVIEYLTSLAGEFWLGYRLWDYSGYLLNLDGRVYAGGSVSAAILGCAFLYYLAPRITDLFLKLKKNIRILLCLVLSALFIAAATLSVLQYLQVCG